MTDHDEAKWETVKRGQGRALSKQNKGKLAPGDGLIDINSADSRGTFGMLDDLEAKMAQYAAQKEQKEKEREKKTSRVAVKGGGVVNIAPIEFAPVVPPKGQAQKQQKKTKESHAAKQAPKHEVAASKCAARLTPEALAEAIAEAEARYPQEEDRVAYIVNAFSRAFKDCSMHFNEIASDAAGAAPWSSLPAPLSAATTKWAKGLAVGAAGRAACSILHDLGMQRAAGQRVNVGELVVVAALLRAQPGAATTCVEDLLRESQTLTGPDTTALFLWALRQMASASVPDALAVWAQALLPQVLGRPFCEIALPAELRTVPVAMMRADSQLAALSYGLELLRPAASRRRPVNVAGAIHPRHLVAACCAAHSASASAAARIPRAARPPLREACVLMTDILARATKGQADTPGNLLVAVLDAAAAHVDTVADPALAELAAIALRCLEASPQAARRWESKHKQNVKGSSRILQALATRSAGFPKALQQVKGSKAFTALVGNLRSRHAGSLKSGPQALMKAANAAEEACVILLGGSAAAPPVPTRGAQGRGRRAARQSSTATGLVAAAVLGAGMAAGACAVAYNYLPAGEQEKMQAAWASVSAAAAPLLKKLEPVVARAGPVVGEIKERLQPAVAEAARRAGEGLATLRTRLSSSG
ncbi:unnamed protein product [Pedinophyceae sp. YPF-701]|nr:unnamed protein product [Pedinophyceae sp. YPF-701]